MIIADENIFRGLIAALRSNNYNVFSVYEELRGSSDVTIAALSLKPPPRIILTEDKDFGHLVFEKNITVTGVIFLRFLNTERDKIITEVLKFLSTQTFETLSGNFFTITPDKIRVKKITDPNEFK